MRRFELLYQLLKFQCFVLNCVGFLKIRFDRAQQRYRLDLGCCCLFAYFPSFLLVLLNFLHLYLRWDLETLNANLNELEPGTQPELDVLDCISQICQNVAYVWIIIRCLTCRLQLWYMVDQAQSIFKHLTSLLRERFVPKCSWVLFLLGAQQFLLLLLLTWKLFWLDRPPAYDNAYNIIRYAMGAVHLLLALLLSLHLFQHLLHAALLQSLNQVLQQLQLPHDLKLLRQLLHVQPLLKRIQHLAAYYFRATFCWYFFVLCFKCGTFVSEFSYDENVLLQSQKSQDDIEDEAEWMGMEALPTRGQLLTSSALQLSWQVAILLPLLCAVKLQLREHKKLFNNIWKIEFPSKSATSRARLQRGCTAKDTISFLLSTRVPFADYRPQSISFMAWKPNANTAVIQFVGIIRGCKMLLQVVLCTVISDFVQQMELRHLQSCLKEISN
ncbi:uncharacterized protein Grl62a [Drosophila virilis]|uniref:Gustatory receptor n=1 Tax=Drosophila virilis TaxID=7244 RepID=B4LBY6_DROVI|nr:uncharacterized protein LOC6622203 [Drosophila virilis]EDW69786.2 uncharacterized protein Dvir_GJ13447 [Drosophila virilis]